MKHEIYSFAETVYLAVDYLPPHFLPSVMKDGQAVLPAQLVLMDETLREPICIDPENPNLVWEDQIEAIAEWMRAAAIAYEEKWKQQLQIRKDNDS